MQDKIILGFLLDQPHTSYSIKKDMEKSIDFFYGTSLGSIHPCLKKLEKNGLCRKKEQMSGKRKSIEYSITKKGRNAFQAWLASTLTMGRVKEESLVKLFFMGHLPKVDILKSIDEYIVEIDQSLLALRVVDKMNQTALKNRTLTSVQKLRLETLRFGIDYLKFSRKWYVDLKKRV